MSWRAVILASTLSGVISINSTPISVMKGGMCWVIFGSRSLTFNALGSVWWIKDGGAPAHG